MPASERQRIDDLRPTGAPLSKSLSTDAADSVPRPRKAYPSVAQGGNRRRAPRYAKKAEEPEFVEWSHSSGLIGAAAEEDDGSGVAWLKKRREERARKAKEDAEAAAKTDASGESSSTKPAEADVQKDKSTDHGIAAVPALQVEPSTPVVERFDHRSSQDELQLEEEEEENQEQSAAASQSHKPASVATVSTAEGEDGEEGDSDEEDDGNARCKREFWGSDSSQLIVAISSGRRRWRRSHGRRARGRGAPCRGSSTYDRRSRSRSLSFARACCSHLPSRYREPKKRDL